MTIGICSPLSICEFLPYLDEESRRKAEGLQGYLAPSVDALVHRYVALGHDVIVFTLTPEVEQTIVLSGKHLKIYVGKYRKRGFLRSYTFFLNEIMILRRFIRNEPDLDVIHAHWTYEFAIASLVARCQAFCTVRDVAEEILKMMPTFYRRARMWMNWYVLKRDDKINFIANSPYTKEILLRYHPKLRIAAVIPNPCGINPINELPDATEGGIRPPIVVSVSHGSGTRKNIDLLVNVFQCVRREVADAELHLVGGAFTPEKWGSRPVPPGVVLCGYVPHAELSKILCSATIMVHPSLEESFGNTLIEAMACGLPVIGGEKSGAVPYVLDHGRAGILCDVTDGKSIASAIVDLLNDRTKRRALALAGLARVRSVFSVEAVCDKTIELYKSKLP